MATSDELAAQLNKEQADYLTRLEGAGQLPTVINNAVDKADNGQTAALRGQEGDLLTKFISAGADNRAKYANVWDPFARDKLAADQTALDYKPITDIRNELAMRAKALGVATSSATSMYNADTAKAQTAIGFTQDAYNRAYQREQDQKAAEERAAALAYQKANDAANRAAAASKSSSKAKSISASDIKNGVSVIQSIPSANPNDRAYDKNGNVIGSKDKYVSKDEFGQALSQLQGLYGDDLGASIMDRAWEAGGFQKYKW